MKEGGENKQRERKIRSRRQTDGRASGQHCGDTGVPGTSRLRALFLGPDGTQGCWHPPGPNPTPPTRLAQEAQTGQTSLAGDAQTANARPTPRGHRRAWLGHCAMAHDCHRASLSPPPAAKGQNKGQRLEPRGSRAPEGAQHPHRGGGQGPRWHLAPWMDPKSWGVWGTQRAQGSPWHSIPVPPILREV